MNGSNNKGVLLITVDFQAAEAGHGLTEIMNACRNRGDLPDRHSPGRDTTGINSERGGGGRARESALGGRGDFDLNIKCMKETPSSSSHRKKPWTADNHRGSGSGA